MDRWERLASSSLWLDSCGLSAITALGQDLLAALFAGDSLSSSNESSVSNHALQRDVSAFLALSRCFSQPWALRFVRYEDRCYEPNVDQEPADGSEQTRSRCGTARPMEQDFFRAFSIPSFPSTQLSPYELLFDSIGLCCDPIAHRHRFQAEEALAGVAEDELAHRKHLAQVTTAGVLGFARNGLFLIGRAEGLGLEELALKARLAILEGLAFGQHQDTFFGVLRLFVNANSDASKTPRTAWSRDFLRHLQEELEKESREESSIDDAEETST
jgi:hypothetical protein